MNPLGQIAGAPSASGALTKSDWKKTGRNVLVNLIGLGLTLGVPWLTGHHYTFNGQDITPEVLAAVSAGVELARRFLAGGSKG